MFILNWFYTWTNDSGAVIDTPKPRGMLAAQHVRRKIHGNR